MWTTLHNPRLRAALMARKEESGVRSPKKVQDPRVPTQAEVDEHNMTHLPYRSWCTHCVRGRGEAHPHHKSGNEERDVPELHMDYRFMGKVDEKAQPILVVKERDTRMMCSMLVGEKGTADEHVIKRIIAFIKELGYESAKIVLKSDQESSVKSVAGSGWVREAGHGKTAHGWKGVRPRVRLKNRTVRAGRSPKNTSVRRYSSFCIINGHMSFEKC